MEFKVIKASIAGLKKDGMIKLVDIIRSNDDCFIAIVEDFFSIFLELTIGHKSRFRIQEMGGLADSLRNSACIALIDERRDELRFTFNPYEELSTIFSLEPIFQEKKGIETVKAILIKKGLRK